jgi:hypothetical protein
MTSKTQTKHEESKHDEKCNQAFFMPFRHHQINIFSRQIKLEHVEDCRT